MSKDGLSDDQVRAILTQTRRVAVVGASTTPVRPSHEVAGFLVRHGFDVTPVNPGHAGETIHGSRIVATLADAVPLEMVDIFRAPQHVAPVVEEAIRLGARIIWMQLGVIDDTAARLARDAGLLVAMNRCPVIEWSRLRLPA